MAQKNTLTGLVRFSFVNVFKPRAAEDGGKEKYSVCIMVPKKDKVTLQKLKEAIDEAKEWGKKEKWDGKLPKNLKEPVRDGDEEREDSPEFEDMYFFNASTLMKPGVIDEDKDEIMRAEEFYSGVWGRALIHFYPFDMKGNRGIGVGLNAVQKLKDDENLGGGNTWSADDFDDDDDDGSIF